VVTALLGLITLASLGLLLMACHRIEVLQERERERVAAAHGVCLSRIELLIGDKHAAETLRRYAEKYGSVAEKTTHMRLAREVYTPGGPDMPVIWMRYYADLLDPPLPEDNAYTLDGERA
jgi:hypothetical protein